MPAEMNIAQCVYCERTVEDVPLLNLTHRHGTAYICPQCLPILIHQPQQLLDVVRLEGRALAGAAAGAAAGAGRPGAAAGAGCLMGGVATRVARSRN